jgi:integrase
MTEHKRRGKGEGSIVKRADGRWFARLDLGYVDGKRRYKAIYGKTRAEVAKKLTTALADKQEGELILTDERMTLEQFTKGIWLPDIVRPSVRPGTYTSYEYICRMHVLPQLGKHRLTTLEPAAVQRFISGRVRAGLSLTSANYCRVVLRIALAEAMRQGFVKRNGGVCATSVKR